MKGSLLVFLLIFFAASDTVIADEFPPSHMCFKPEPPLFLASRRHQERYRDDVIRYERCMNAFLTEQKESIRMHDEALKQGNIELEKFRKTRK